MHYSNPPRLKVNDVLRRPDHMAMAKKIFVGRHREKPYLWNVMFQRDGEIILSQATSHGPLDTDALKRHLNLPAKAVVLVELA